MDNRFSLKKLNPHIKFLSFLSFGFLLFLICFFWKFSFKSGLTYEGVYSCKKNVCTVTSYFLVSDILKMNDTQKFFLNKQEQDFKISNIYDAEIIQNVAFQKIVFTIPKQDFYENQTVSFFIQKEEKNIWQILWENMKGGDALS